MAKYLIGAPGRAAAACLVPWFAPQAAVAETSASFLVSATIEAGCEVNGSVPAPNAGIGQIGTLAFGTHSALATGPVTATMVQSGGFPLACTPTALPTMTLDGGLHGGSTGSALRNLESPAGAAERIAYRLYRDAGFNQELLAGQAYAVSLDNPLAITLPIHGRLTLAGNRRAAVYSDTVVVTLTW